MASTAIPIRRKFRLPAKRHVLRLRGRDDRAVRLFERRPRRALLGRDTFGFDFETGVTPVTLDMEQEYYRLEITRKKTE